MPGIQQAKLLNHEKENMMQCYKTLHTLEDTETSSPLLSLQMRSWSAPVNYNKRNKCVWLLETERHGHKLFMNSQFFYIKKWKRFTEDSSNRWQGTVAFFQICPTLSLHKCSLPPRLNLKVCFKEQNQLYLPFQDGITSTCFAWGYPRGLSFHPHGAHTVPFRFLFVLLLKKEKIK